MTSGAEAVHRDSEILGGTPVFTGTRVPVRETLEEFMRQFPSVPRAQAVAVLALARDAVIARGRYG